MRTFLRYLVKLGEVAETVKRTVERLEYLREHLETIQTEDSPGGRKVTLKEAMSVINETQRSIVEMHQDVRKIL